MPIRNRNAEKKQYVVLNNGDWDGNIYDSIDEATGNATENFDPECDAYTVYEVKKVGTIEAKKAHFVAA